MIKEKHIFTDSDKHVYFLIKELKTFYERIFSKFEEKKCLKSLTHAPIR